MSFFRRNSTKQSSEAASEPPSPLPAPKRLTTLSSASNSSPHSPNSSSASTASADDSESGATISLGAVEDPTVPTPWSFALDSSWKEMEGRIEPPNVRGDRREAEIVRPTTDCGPYDAKILICADSIGRPLELKIMEICGLTVYITAWGGKTIADVLERSVFLRSRGVGTKVLVLIAGTNDISQLVCTNPAKSACPTSCQEAAKQLVNQYRFFLKHNCDRYDVVFLTELLPQKWEDEGKQALATMLIESFNKELANLVAEYEFMLSTDDEKRDLQIFLIPVYDEFDFDDLDALNNGKESSVHLKYVGLSSERAFRRNQAGGDVQKQRHPREKFATVIGEFLQKKLCSNSQTLEKKQDEST
ncbi:hypothetical protein RvY_03494 [Ramazzottius varieornatus]|uniref:Uncharacterized protein n=1 Tax=Ramazzottius varieornatus TaxID=947166 RepID=A0A1D1UVB3_RAMVA|nr:hypothetical protein RvY_03494 [Ramazzottius varieornatus]